MIEHPVKHPKAFGEGAAIKHGSSFKDQLRQTINRVIPDCESYEEFLARMRREGYEIKESKQTLSFRAPGQERFTRSHRLGDDYTPEALRERCERRRGYSGSSKHPSSVGVAKRSICSSTFRRR